MRRKLLSHLTPQPSRVVVVAVIVSLGFSATAIAAAGDPDPMFSGDGRQTTNFSPGNGDEANDVAIQSDGKIVVVGYIDPDDFALARYNPNGTLDTSFSGDGKQTTDFGGYEATNAVAVQGDGKIVAVGVSSNNSTTNGAAFVLARYNPNGSLDTSFSGDGKQAIGSDFDAATDVAIQANGKIVAVGTCCGGVAIQANGRRGGGRPPTIRDFALARYNPNGSLDTLLGDGKQTTDFSAASRGGRSRRRQIVVVGCVPATSCLPATTRTAARRELLGGRQTTSDFDGPRARWLQGAGPRLDRLAARLRSQAMEFAVRLLRKGARLPSRAHEGDAGLDLHAVEPATIGPGSGPASAPGSRSRFPPATRGWCCHAPAWRPSTGSRWSTPLG